MKTNPLTLEEFAERRSTHHHGSELVQWVSESSNGKIAFLVTAHCGWRLDVIDEDDEEDDYEDEESTVTSDNPDGIYLVFKPANYTQSFSEKDLLEFNRLVAFHITGAFIRIISAEGLFVKCEYLGHYSRIYKGLWQDDDEETEKDDEIHLWAGGTMPTFDGDTYNIIEALEIIKKELRLALNRVESSLKVRGIEYTKADTSNWRYEH